jgi:hypothetical protein
MKSLVGLACSGAVAVVALISAGPAAAAISPTLAVTTTNSGGANVIIAAGVSNPSEDPFAKIQIYVPTGFELNAPVGGTTVGSVSGKAVVKDIDPSQEASFTGKVVAIGATDPAVAFENANCDNTAHAAAWMMQLSSSEGQVNIPIFVDKTAGTEARFGSYKLVVCLRSPDLAQADQNRSPGGTKVDSLLLTLAGFKVPTAAGDYRWRSLWTPYTPGTGTVNAAGNVEAQSLVRIPSGALTISARKVTVTVNGRSRTHIRLSGQLTIAGKASARYPVAVSHGSDRTRLTVMGSVKTNSGGNYVISSTFKKPTYYQAGVTIARRDLGPGGCTPSFGASVHCVNAIISGSRVISRVIHVMP